MRWVVEQAKEWAAVVIVVAFIWLMAVVAFSTYNEAVDREVQTHRVKR